MRRIYELHGEAAGELGYAPLPIAPGHFTMDDLVMVQQVFPAITRQVLQVHGCSRGRSLRCGFMRPIESMLFGIDRRWEPSRSAAWGDAAAHPGDY
jgi:hypothetical protein